MLRVSMVIDYQNVHLTARDVFNPRGGRHESLIHPMEFARRAILERNKRQRAGYPEATLERVTIHRGLPHVDYDWEQNRRCIDQAVQSRRDGAIVNLRDLKYQYELQADGRPVIDVNGKKIPIRRPREKGVDVLCALTCVREAGRPDVDVVVLASRDADLQPVLDEVHDLRSDEPRRYAQIETVAWVNRRARQEGAVSGGSLRPTALAESGTPTWVETATRHPWTGPTTGDAQHGPSSRS